MRSRGLRVVAEDADAVTVRVEAGEPWDDLVAATVERGWPGWSASPASPARPAPPRSRTSARTARRWPRRSSAVEAYDRTHGTVVRIAAADCGFAYRGSIFKHSDRWVVLSVDFRLTRSPLSGPVRYAELARALGVEVGDRVPLAEARAAVRRCAPARAWCSTRGPGHLVGGLVLHQPGAGRGRRTSAAGARRPSLGEPPTWPGAGDGGQGQRRLADRQGRLRQGVRGAGGVAISTSTPWP